MFKLLCWFVLFIAIKYNDALPNKCQYHADLMNAGLLTGSMFHQVDPYCVELYRISSVPDEVEFCSKHEDVCFKYVQKARMEGYNPDILKRRMMKGEPPTPATPKPTGAPTSRPTKAPSKSPTVSPTTAPTFSDSTLDTIYFKYPSGMSFDVTNVENAYTDDFKLLDVTAHEGKYVTVYSEQHKKDVLTRFRRVKTWHGFVFDGEVLKYILQAKKDRTNMDYKITRLKNNNLEFYERRYADDTPAVYIDRHFGYKDRTDEGYGRANIHDTYLLMSKEDMTFEQSSDMRALCETLPRCLGYIPTRGLVSTLAIRKQDLVEISSLSEEEWPLLDSEKYYEKETVHAIIHWIERNVMIVIILSAVFIGVTTLLIWGIERFIYRIVGKLVKLYQTYFGRKIRPRSKVNRQKTDKLLKQYRAQINGDVPVTNPEMVPKNGAVPRKTIVRKQTQSAPVRFFRWLLGIVPQQRFVGVNNKTYARLNTTEMEY